MISFSFPFRMTGYGGITLYYVYCPICRKFLEPRRVRSKTGNHGDDIYEHEHEVEWVLLERSNSGKKSVSSSPGFPKSLFDFLRNSFLANDYPSIEEVNEYLSRVEP